MYYLSTDLGFYRMLLYYKYPTECMTYIYAISNVDWNVSQDIFGSKENLIAYLNL